MAYSLIISGLETVTFETAISSQRVYLCLNKPTNVLPTSLLKNFWKSCIFLTIFLLKYEQSSSERKNFILLWVYVKLQIMYIISFMMWIPLSTSHSDSFPTSVPDCGKVCNFISLIEWLRQMQTLTHWGEIPEVPQVFCDLICTVN